MSWQPRPAAGPVLVDGDVHMWLVELDQPPAVVVRLALTLSDRERVRAHAFRSLSRRNGFIVAHGALRDILARYLDQPAGELSYAESALGKPYLLGRPVRFNVAHSAGLALVGVALESELGVDIERVRTIDYAGDIAKRFFAPSECARLQAMAGKEEFEAAFFRCWTRKEAFVKAHGAGLSYPLDGFEVGFLSGEQPTLSIDGMPAVDWALHELPVPPPYEAALVVHGQPSSNAMRYWSWLPHEGWR